MGEIILSSILENLVGKTSSLVRDEVCLARDFDKDLKRLNNNLSTIKAVLLDAEQKQVQNRELHLWLGTLKDFCYEAEDVLDEMEYEGLRKQVVKQHGTTITKVCRFFSSSNPLVLRFKMGHKVKELRESLDEIAAQKSKFHLTELIDYRQVGSVGNRVRELTDSFVLMSKVFGREDEKERIMRFLLQPIDKKVDVIPIVGLGGLGKTTLAKMLYNDNRIDERFELKMWVCITEDGFDKKKTLLKMFNSLTEQNLSDYNPEQMQIFIRDKLKGSKFVLVLDDVWSTNRNEWVELLDLLEEGESGSKIIVTTRSNAVAKILGTTGAYELEGLPLEDCVSLFKKMVFNEGEAEGYPNLVEIGNDIVHRCKGVPLAIRTLGSLLYANKNEEYWISIRDNEIWRLEQRKEDILPVLKLSYDQLPPYLKPCFAICSIFPKDLDLNSHTLTEFWVAHGLLQSSNGKEELEDIGLQYIKELCSRSLFQDIKEFGYDWIFKMHDLVHDLAMSIAHNEYLVVNERIRNISKGTRHIRIFDVEVLLDIEDPKGLRTIISQKDPVPQYVADIWLSTCRHLRTLILRFSSVVPPSIGGLKHLRYLVLNLDEGTKKLPDSFWELHNLQILYLKGCVEELPRDIRKLIRLRTLRFTTKQKRLPKDGLSSLKHLHSLQVVDCTNLEVLFEEKQEVSSLRFLLIRSCENLISLAPTPKCFAALETLMIDNCPCLDLMEDIHHDIPSRLQFLCVEMLPQWKTLPQWLQKSAKTLQSMFICDCENLSSLPEWLLIFKSLKRLVISNCPKLSTLPEEGISQLTALELLVLEDCPALSERYKRNTGEGWDKISHIPDIDIN